MPHHTESNALPPELRNDRELNVIILILVLIDKFPVETNPYVAIKRVIIIGFPALFGAVISDYIK